MNDQNIDDTLLDQTDNDILKKDVILDTAEIKEYLKRVMTIKVDDFTLDMIPAVFISSNNTIVLKEKPPDRFVPNEKLKKIISNIEGEEVELLAAKVEYIGEYVKRLIVEIINYVPNIPENDNEFFDDFYNKIEDWSEERKVIENILSLVSKQYRIFVTAFTDSSMSTIVDNFENENYEAFELEGDSILACAVKRYLIRVLGHKDEQTITTMASYYTEKIALIELSKLFKFDKLILIDSKNLTSEKYEDIFEAFIGALSYIETQFQTLNRNAINEQYDNIDNSRLDIKMNLIGKEFLVFRFISMILDNIDKPETTSKPARTWIGEMETLLSDKKEEGIKFFRPTIVAKGVMVKVQTGMSLIKKICRITGQNMSVYNKFLNSTYILTHKDIQPTKATGHVAEYILSRLEHYHFGVNEFISKRNLVFMKNHEADWTSVEKEAAKKKIKIELSRNKTHVNKEMHTINARIFFEYNHKLRVINIRGKIMNRNEFIQNVRDKINQLSL